MTTSGVKKTFDPDTARAMIEDHYRATIVIRRHYPTLADEMWERWLTHVQALLDAIPADTANEFDHGAGWGDARDGRRIQTQSCCL